MKHYARFIRQTTVAPAIVLLGRTWNTNAGNKTVSVTPNAGDLIVVVCACTGQTSPVPSDDLGGTYAWQVEALKASNADGMSLHYRNELATGATMLVQANQSSSTGGGVAVFAVRGGLAPWGQGNVNNVAAGTTPAPVLNTGAPLTTSIILGVSFGGATVSIAQRAGYTEHFDKTFSSPAAYWEAMSRVGGETSATITWGGNPGTGIHCALVQEFRPQ